MVLVTGATGFIGSNLMCKLAKDNVFPVALFRHESNKERVWKLFKSNFSDAKARFEKITWRKADFRNYPSLSAAFKDITYVYHCAGFISLSHKDAKKLLEINENGTAFLVDLCLENEIKKLVYVSSIAAVLLGPERTRARVRSGLDVIGGVSKKGAKRLEKSYQEALRSIDTELDAN